jgi:hypothetical protein
MFHSCRSSESIRIIRLREFYSPGLKQGFWGESWEGNVNPLHAFEIGVVLGAAIVVLAIYFRHRLAKKAVSVLSEMP